MDSDRFGQIALELGILDIEEWDYVISDWHKRKKKVSLRDYLLNQGYLEIKEIEQIENRLQSNTNSFKDRYEIQNKLGEGGMGIVIKVYDKYLNRSVALKRATSTSKTDRKRFERESKFIAQMNHPNIVRIYDTGKDEKDNPYFTMEYIAGKPLNLYIKKQKETKEQLEIEKILTLMIKIGEAVSYAHRHQIIHRDLKPANIMVDENDEPKVMDFGLAKDLFDQQTLAKTGEMLGTLDYMPPEQLEGQIRKTDERSDVYSFGVMLYEMLTLTTPFHGKYVQKTEQILKKEPRRPSEINTKLSSDYDIICLKAMEKKRENRYASLSLLVDDLYRLKRGDSVISPGIWQILRKKIYRYRKVIITAVIILATFFIAWYAFSLQKEKTNQAKARKIVNKVRQFIKQQAISAKQLAHKYPHKTTEEISVREQEERKNIMLAYQQQQTKLLQAFVLDPKNRKVKKLIYLLSREMGLIAIGGRNYLIAELSFDSCKVNAKEQRTNKLFENLNKEKKHLEILQNKRLKQIMLTLGKGPPEQAMIDEYTTEIMKMKSRYIVKSIIPYITSKYFWQRYVAIESLGKLKNLNTKYKEKDVGQWLTERLLLIRKNIQLKQKQNEQTIIEQEVVDEAIAIIWALARLQDSRANKLITDVRLDFGQNSRFWYQTAIPYCWIPVLEKGAKSAFDWQKIGQMKSDKGDLSGALKAFDRALSIKPTSEIYNNRALVLSDMNRYNEAIDDFSHALQLLNIDDQKRASIYHNRGVCYRNHGYVEQALEDFQQVLIHDPKFSHTYTVRFSIYLEKNLFDKAIKDCKSYINLRPDEGTGYSHLGLVYSKQNKWNKSLENYTIAIKQDPTMAMFYNNRAEAYWKLKNYQKALEDCNQAIHLDPQLAKAYNIRGLVFQDIDQPKLALKDYNLAILLNANYDNAYSNRATLYFQTGFIDKARRDFNKSIQINPKNWHTRINYSALLRTQKETKQSFAELNYIIGQNPDYVDAYFNRGVMHYENAQYSNAIADFGKTIALSPQRKITYLYIGLAYRKNGHHQKAAKNFKKYLELCPNDIKNIKKWTPYIQKYF